MAIDPTALRRHIPVPPLPAGMIARGARTREGSVCTDRRRGNGHSVCASGEWLTARGPPRSERACRPGLSASACRARPVRGATVCLRSSRSYTDALRGSYTLSGCDCWGARARAFVLGSRCGEGSGVCLGPAVVACLLWVGRRDALSELRGRREGHPPTRATPWSAASIRTLAMTPMRKPSLGGSCSMGNSHVRGSQERRASSPSSAKP